MLPKHDHDMTGAGGKQELGLWGALHVRRRLPKFSPSLPKAAAAGKKKKNEKKILIPSAPVRLFYARIVILKRACVS